MHTRNAKRKCQLFSTLKNTLAFPPQSQQSRTFAPTLEIILKNIFNIYQSAWWGYIRLTLTWFKIDVMPLVPETKMADARKHSVSGTTWSELKTTSAFQFHPAFLELTPWHILYKYFFSQHFFSFSHFTHRATTLSPVWLPEKTLPLSHFHYQLLTAMKMYMSRNHSLNSYTFSMRLF